MGNLEEGSSIGDFSELDEGALGMEHLSLQRLCGRGLRGSSFTVDPARYAKKFPRYGHLSPCIVLYLLCVRQIHTSLDIELVKYYIVTVTEWEIKLEDKKYNYKIRYISKKYNYKVRHIIIK